MSRHIKRSVILAILAVLTALAAAKSELAYARHTCLPSAEEGVKHVNPGDDLDAIVNSDPATSATTFCIHAGTYLIDSVVVPRDGDALLGRARNEYGRRPRHETRARRARAQRRPP